MTARRRRAARRSRDVGVRITGSGASIPFGRFEGKTPTDMGVARGTRRARRGRQSRSSRPRSAAPRTAGSRSGHKVLGALALTGVPIVDVEAGCASGGAALQLAAGAIRAGQYDCVLVFGIEKMPKGIIRSSFFEPWREEAGLAATPAYFALRAQRLLREAGLTQGAPGRGRREEPPQRRAQPERDVPQGRSRSRRCSRRASCASRCTCGCCARPTRARPRSCSQRGRRAACSSRRPRCARTSPGSVLGEATPLSGIDDTGITPAVDPRRAATRTPRRASDPTTSTSSSARTPTRPASCSRTRSSTCARRASRRKLARAEPRASSVNP